MRVILLLAALAAPAQATEVIRLSEAQREAVLEAAANGPERPQVLTPEPALRSSVLTTPLYPGPDDGTPDRRVHGEVSMFAGSGGTFGVSGTAVMPVGNSGMAAISLMRGTSNWGGLSGFSLGYASDGSMIGGGLGGGFGGGFSGWGGPWGNPWLQGPAMRPRPVRRVR